MDMMKVSTRIVHTHDTEANWNKCTNFIPNQAELIVYDPDEDHPYPRFKLGDGINNIVKLPFYIDINLENILNLKDGINYIDAGRITEY